MIRLYDPDAVRGMDRRAFAEGVEPAALMERAAGHLARAVLAVGGRGYGLRVGLLCGKGNNGGDGIAAARRLLGAGAAPRVHLVVGEEGLGPEGVAQLRRYRAVGGRVAADLQAALDGAEVVVDCLLGTGAAGTPRPPFDAAVRAVNDAPAPVVACDVPTGVDAATGAVPADAVRADVTVTLGAEKVGLRLWPARGHCGRLVLGELGIVRAQDEPAALLLEPPDAAAALPAAAPEAEKRARGVVLVVAGAEGMAGAAVLVARGALAAGAGLVTVATAEAERHVVAGAVPEALTLGLPDDAEDARRVLGPALEAADALALGPGLGRGEQAVALARALVRDVSLPVVLDADGLNAFRHDGDALAAHASPLLVLTPHAREFARLLGADVEAVWVQRLDTAAQRAKAWNAVLVVKGPGSVVAAPDGRRWVNPTGSAALASGGTGDVLTGVLGALVAAAPSVDTVAAGVFLHGLAGQIAADRGESRSVTAGEVADAVPFAYRALETL